MAAAVRDFSSSLLILKRVSSRVKLGWVVLLLLVNSKRLYRFSQLKVAYMQAVRVIM